MTHSIVKLVVDGLAVERGGRLVLADLSFSCAAGEALVVRGVNGSGKSTLLRALATLLDVRSGKIRLEGLDLEDERQRAEYVHYLGHLDGIKTALTVEENLAIWQSYYGGAVSGGLTAALEAFDLTPLRDLPAQYLSAGQKKRLALSRLLVVRRPLWLLDEPSVSLDARNKERLADLINQHTGDGGLAIVTSHEDINLAHAKHLPMDQTHGEAA